jgi:hypothetical protein
MTTTETPIKYSFPKSTPMSDIESRVQYIFSCAISFKSTQAELIAELQAKIYEPLNYRCPSGKRKHSTYLSGFAQGLIRAAQNDLSRNHHEFCYLVDGEIYSTHHSKNTKRSTTNCFYDAGLGHRLNDAPSAIYWKDSDKIYFQ